MMRKILITSIPILFLFNLLLVSAESTSNIELLDIQESKVITIPLNSEIHLETKKVIEEIDTLVKKFKPIPDKGYIIKIPLSPPLRLENKWMNTTINEVIIIIPEDEKPYLLIFDDEIKPHFFTVKTEIDTLLKTLNFPL